MKSTGPVLALGTITVFNEVIVHNKPINWRIPVATVAAVGAFTLFERANEPLAVGLAWLALVAVLFTRTSPGTPSPVESALEWWNSGGN